MEVAVGALRPTHPSSHLREPMPPTKRTCPDCREPLVDGVVIDYRRGTAHPSEWVEAELKTSVWTGSVKNETRYEVIAYRCTGCGLLRLYADTPATAPGNPYG